MIHITSQQQINKLSKLRVVPEEVQKNLEGGLDGMVNQRGFIPGYMDGWVVYIYETADELRNDNPNAILPPLEYTYEFVDRIECSSRFVWIVACILNNNESSTTYVFPEEFYPEFMEEFNKSGEGWRDL